MTSERIHTVTDCNPERIYDYGSKFFGQYKLRNYLFATEKQAREFMDTNRPKGPLGFTYCYQRWQTPYSFENFLYTDNR